MPGYDSICCFSGVDSIEKRVCWELLTDCNLNCFFCHRYNENRSIFNYKNIDTVIDLLNENNIKNVIISGGEPLCHPDIFNICDRLVKNGFKIDLCTNAVFDSSIILNKLIKYFPEISISIDWYESSRHDEIRGKKGAFDTSIKNIRSLIASGVKINTTTLVTIDIIDDIQLIVEYLYDIGVQTMSFIGYIPFNIGHNNLLEPENQQKLHIIFKRLREKYKNININTKQLISNKDIKCKAGEIVYGLDSTGKQLYPCLLLRERNKKILNNTTDGCCPGSKYYTK